MIEDLLNRFSIRDIIFVEDRGMMTVDNIEPVKQSGNNYIMGLQKRNRRIVKYLMPIVLKAGKSSRIQEFIYEDLSEELKKEYSERVRFIACYNKDVAKVNR
ncbi:MAG: hypothetical protein KAX28_13170 [Candidatus Marinimicrobia bacterium]|nr:hypothetical protein [Candidatus Neomarinimicrobiota bacterium]